MNAGLRAAAAREAEGSRWPTMSHGAAATAEQATRRPQYFFIGDYAIPTEDDDCAELAAPAVRGTKQASD